MDNKKEISYFVLIIAFVLALISTSLIYLGFFYDGNKYNNIEYEGYEFNYPLGYNSKIIKEEEFDYLCVYNDDIAFDIRLLDDGSTYSEFKSDNFSELKEFLKGFDYQVISAKEINHNLGSIILIEINHENKTCYFYVFNYTQTKDLFYGYIYNEKDLTDKNVEVLIDILSNANKK